MEVRIRAGDKAGNRTEMSIPVSYSADGRAPDPPPASGDASAPRDGNTSNGGGGPGGIFYSKSTKISIGYRFDRRPISGIQVFDLWYTTDTSGVQEITTAGTPSVLIPSGPGANGSAGIVKGPDGNAWATEQGNPGDLARALAFYRDGLGLASAGVIGTEFAGDATHPAGAIALFELHGGLLLAKETATWGGLRLEPLADLGLRDAGADGDNHQGEKNQRNTEFLHHSL